MRKIVQIQRSIFEWGGTLASGAGKVAGSGGTPTVDNDICLTRQRKSPVKASLKRFFNCDRESGSSAH